MSVDGNDGSTDWTYHECPFCGETVGRLPAHLQQCEEADEIGHSQPAHPTPTSIGGQQ